MVVGKNKCLTKGSKKGAKKKMVDPFSKKDWYDVKAPDMFNIRNIGKTLITRTQGTKIASDGLKGRVFEVSLADLQNDEIAFRKFKLITEDVHGKNCLTNFHGMDLTLDKMCSMVKKWQKMTEAHVDVKTTDGYVLRLFRVGFTKKRNNQIRKTSYAQHQQVRQIRKKMMEIMTREVQTNDLKEVVNKLIPDSIGKEREQPIGRTVLSGTITVGGAWVLGSRPRPLQHRSEARAPRRIPTSAPAPRAERPDRGPPPAPTMYAFVRR
ncbi:PREDICTED: 40S ribosomal protein S3a-like [Rhinopithecus bieti]|uniref:40S ribosomal protein S3a-like n=1 Tax=Rhinopithecus bieti TaxID=61621 RepID=UPI00083BB87B|nr:PREDICTED: 40S ribosomal protein S3a-like [Rhinopithecus bieti]